MEIVKEKWTTPVATVILGATKEEGGTRTKALAAGGETTLPYLYFEGDIPNPPLVAMEVIDKVPDEYPPAMHEIFGDALKDPGKWAKKCVEEFGADMICLKLLSAHPDEGNTGAAEARAAVRKVLDAVGVPIIVLGPGVHDKDNEVLPAVSEEAKGERILLGNALQDNYKTIVASALADGHAVIGESPIDINIAKQVNILMNEMGIPMERIIMYPTTGGLGYGIEYAFSIMERSRIAALGGDKVLGVPMICFIGQESWRAKEAKADNPEWGDLAQRGIVWEATTALAFIHAGAGILVMRHPEAVKIIKKTLQGLTKHN